MIDRERLQKADALFHELLNVPPSDRAATLAARCAGDEPLRTVVQRLLRADSSGMDGFMSCPISVPGVDAAPPPQTIGRYTVVREIGRGGMGVVYEARQQSPARAVALKVMRTPFPTRESLRRFRHEAEILGFLRHPGIAQVYEAGVADVPSAAGAQAVPFLAMELLRGEPVTTYGHSRNLDTRQRLELFAEICDAVQHAHQKGVIHRDLKPGNILIDDSGRPKVLDFGVARAVGDDVETASLRTAAGQLIGTLPYMSPEQVSGDPRQLDTRSDVYALGALLFEVLTNRMPVKLQDCSLADAARIITSEAPRRLSTIDRRFGGDIEAIVARAMEKDKSRRYASAAELASDIRRYLAGEPIEAKRDSHWYVLRKTAGRYKAVLSVASAFLLLVSGAAVSLAVLYQNQTRERARAERETAKAEAVKDFLTGMLELGIPQNGRGYEVSLHDVLDEASRHIADGALAAQPEVEAEVRETLGQVYHKLGLDPSAVPHFEWLLEYRTRRFGGVSQAVAEALWWLGLANIETNSAEAESVLRRCVQVSRQVYGSESTQVFRAMDFLGNSLMRQGRPGEALEWNQAATEGKIRLHGEDSVEAAQTMFNLAGTYRSLGRLDEAIELYDRALPVIDTKAGSNLLIRFRRWYAVDVYQRRRMFAEAEQFLRQTLALVEERLGVDHPETALVQLDLGRVLTRQGRTEEAQVILEQALQRWRRARGPAGPGEWWFLSGLATCLDEQGKHAAAVEMLLNSVQEFTELRGSADKETLELMEWLGGLLVRRGQRAQAVSLLDDLTARVRAAYGPGDVRVADWDTRAARMLLSASYLGEAGAFARSALEAWERLPGEGNPGHAARLQRLGSLLSDEGEWEPAERAFRLALALRREVLGNAHEDTASSLESLAQACVHLGRLGEAKGLYAEALAICEQRLHPDDSLLIRVRLGLARLLAGQGRYAEGEGILLEFHDLLAGPPSSDARCDVMEGLVSLYESWHAAEPDAGYDARAAEWSARLARENDAISDQPEPRDKTGPRP